MRKRAVGQHRVDREHVLARVAVAQRARAARIVGRHAADGGARGSRDVDRKPQTMRLELPIEIIEHNAGLDHATARGNVELEEMVEVFRAIDHQRGVDRLAGLRGAATTRRHAHALVPRNRYRPIGVLYRARRHNAEGHDLVVGRIGRVAAAGEAVEHDVANALRPQAALQPRHDRFAHPHHLARGYRPYSPKALTDSRIRPSWRQVATGGGS